MKHTVVPLLLVLMAGLCSASSGAGEALFGAGSLGEVEAPVSGRSAALREDALREGLSEVLVRMTGLPVASEVPGNEALLARPTRWLEQYGYADAERGLLLRATFNTDALSSELARAGAPLWGETRPTALLWLVNEAGSIVGRETESPFVDVLRDRAAYRGMPMRLPELDDEDREQIVAADIRGRFDRQITEASARYQSGLILTAVIYPGARPTLRWRLLHDGEQVREGTLEGSERDDAERLVAALVDLSADHVAGLYSVVLGEDASVVLRVEALPHVRAHEQARAHVAGLAGMQSVNLVRLTGDAAEFNLAFSGSPLQLERLLRLHPSLRPCEDVLGAEAQVGVLRVCWRDSDG